MSKFIKDDPHYGPKIKEIEEDAVKMTEQALKNIASLSDPLQKAFQDKVHKMVAARVNQFRKKYGRSKYLPH